MVGAANIILMVEYLAALDCRRENDERLELFSLAEHTHMAGASAGSILAVCHHSGLTTDVIAAACLELADDCRSKGTRGRLGVSTPPPPPTHLQAQAHCSVIQKLIASLGSSSRREVCKILANTALSIVQLSLALDVILAE